MLCYAKLNAKLAHAEAKHYLSELLHWVWLLELKSSGSNGSYGLVASNMRT